MLRSLKSKIISIILKIKKITNLYFYQITHHLRYSHDGITDKELSPTLLKKLNARVCEANSKDNEGFYKESNGLYHGYNYVCNAFLNPDIIVQNSLQHDRDIDNDLIFLEYIQLQKAKGYEKNIICYPYTIANENLEKNFRIDKASIQ